MVKQFYLTHRWDLKGTSIPGQSGSGSNGNKGVLHILQSFEAGAQYHMRFSVVFKTVVRGGEVLLLHRGSIGVFSSPNRLDEYTIWFGLVWFYGTSTIVGYLIPNPFYTYKQFYFTKVDMPLNKETK